MKHPLERLENVENEYCQKCKKDKSFCPHMLKDVQNCNTYLKHPLTR